MMLYSHKTTFNAVAKSFWSLDGCHCSRQTEGMQMSEQQLEMRINQKKFNVFRFVSEN